jgi:hypothetical protein
MRRSGKLIFVSIILCLLVGRTEAQDTLQEKAPVRSVAFVAENRQGLNTATTTNMGDEGITRLGQIFVQYGAQLHLITLNSRIDDRYELVVLIRPTQPLSAQQTAYLWDFLQRGGHLLLALDPNGHNDVSSERSRSSGISQLLYTEYGISIMDDIWIEPWFGVESLSDIVTSWSEAKADDLVPHPITAPLVTYDLPLRFWGGRSVFVDGLTGVSNTNALIYDETAYGETGQINLHNTKNDQFTINIGEDSQGRLLLGAIAENYETGSRVALIGDGGIFQNIYGQTRLPGNDAVPLYPGTFIFTQRLVAWLMGIPETQWPSLPNEFTWIAMDGVATDWPANIPEVTDIVPETQEARYDIQGAKALHNDQFLYLAVETTSDIPEDAQFTIQMTSDYTPLTIILDHGEGRVIFADGLITPIDDAEYAISSGIEIRLPLRIVGTNPIIKQFCISNASVESLDCVDMTLRSTLVNTIDPVPLRFSPGPTAFLIHTANVRSSPSENSSILLQRPARTLLSVVGRNESGDWLKVRDGRYEGWVAAFLVAVNSDIDSLPVVLNE